MEKTTFINGNGQPYERAVPTVVIATYINPLALENLRRQTGIDFQPNAYGRIEGHPETWEQLAKVFLTYNWLTRDQNNWDGNIIHLRGASHVPFDEPLFYEKGGDRFEGVAAPGGRINFI